jgi:hypothetical protein
MMLLVCRARQNRIQCACGRDHGVLSEHFENIGFSESLPQGVVEIERHDRSGKIVRIAKVACKCGMRSRFAEDFSCDNPRACPACGACIECALCSCRDENPLGSYR